jgi:hypothetical protein
MTETAAKTRARAISKQRKKDAGFNPHQIELLPEALDEVKKYARKKNREYMHLHPGSEKYL